MWKYHDFFSLIAPVPKEINEFEEPVIQVVISTRRNNRTISAVPLTIHNLCYSSCCQVLHKTYLVNINQHFFTESITWHRCKSRRSSTNQVRLIRIWSKNNWKKNILHWFSIILAVKGKQEAYPNKFYIFNSFLFYSITVSLNIPNY